MKWTVTTSDAYHHCLPIFFKLWERHINKPLELVGYKKPQGLPDYVNWVSLGKQRGPQFFSDDLAPYFAKQSQWFIWLMEDTFIKGFDELEFNRMRIMQREDVGRIGLTRDIVNRAHTVYGSVAYAHPHTSYRLSTQPSIWNRDFLLQYLTPNLDPWQFEKQPTVDGWKVYGPLKNAIDHNEGVRKHDIYKFDLNGIEL